MSIPYQNLGVNSLGLLEKPCVKSSTLLLNHKMIISLSGLSFHSKNRIVNGRFLFITLDGIYKSINPTLVICYEVLGPKTEPAILQCMRDIIR